MICSFCPRKLDFDPLAVPIPYHHSNLQSEEMIYYVSGNFGSRKGVEVGSITLHPSGLPHGPQPGLAEKSIGMHETHELAVMCDTFNPLQAVDVRARPRRRDVLALVVRERGGRRRRREDADASGAGPHLAPLAPPGMALLAAPEPFSLELTTARFRAFGLDRATVWEDGALYRVVGGREVRIAAADGGVDVEPLDAETEPVVRKLLGLRRSTS